MTARDQTRQRGFTVIELIVVAIVLAVAGVMVFAYANNVSATNQDEQRKTAINAMYYALEEVYYKQHSSYPASLTAATLPSVDPALFTDPDGFTLGKEALSEDELEKLISNGDTSDDTAKRLTAISAGKSPNYHYDGKDCDAAGNCKSYTLRADLVKEAEYVKKNRTH